MSAHLIRRVVALVGSIRARRVSRTQSRDGMAVCGFARAAGEDLARGMAGASAACARAFAFHERSGRAVRVAADWALGRGGAGCGGGGSLGLGVTKLVSSRHPRWASWTGMRVGFRDLTIWSFLMATAHGAGLMLLPVLFSLPAGQHSQHVHGEGATSAALADRGRDPHAGISDDRRSHRSGSLSIRGAGFSKAGLAQPGCAVGNGVDHRGLRHFDLLERGSRKSFE